MSVTIRDVALRAGVSPITVSRAFSGTHPVSAETRSKVLKAAEELGYVPDLLARGLVHRRSPIIGFIMLELDNPFFAPIIDAVQEVAWDRKHMLAVSQSQRRLDMEKFSIHQFSQMRMAGIVITPASTDLDHLQGLKERGISVVVVARSWDGGDYVTVDDLAGGRMVAEHLLRLGHQRIGCIAHSEPSNTAVQTRVQGFRAALENGGCAFPAQWMIHTRTVLPADSAQAVDALLALSERPTAVFVTADSLAIGFIHRLRERGVRVPEDIAVVGYDDIRYATFMEVPLTTIALPKYEMGRRAAEILFERIGSEEESGDFQHIRLTPELVIRRSCGAVGTAGSDVRQMKKQ
jgi:LacI family transcriptional regulator